LNYRRCLAGFLVAVILNLTSTVSHSQPSRRISTGALPVYYLFDDGYFGIESGLGVDALLRFEISRNVFIENRLGGYTAEQDGTDIAGLNGQLGVTAIFPVWIPYRPSARFALALLTVNPSISEPVKEFRPSQTVFYMVFGLGMTRVLKGMFQIEAGADVMFTPYEYRIYEFYRQYYEAREAGFLHLSFYLGASYTF
jgi:hypothetical protein